MVTPCGTAHKTTTPSLVLLPAGPFRQRKRITVSDLVKWSTSRPIGSRRCQRMHALTAQKILKKAFMSA
jgi:hypothetical protein